MGWNSSGSGICVRKLATRFTGFYGNILARSRTQANDLGHHAAVPISPLELWYASSQSPRPGAAQSLASAIDPLRACRSHKYLKAAASHTPFNTRVQANQLKARSTRAKPIRELLSHSVPSEPLPSA